MLVKHMARRHDVALLTNLGLEADCMRRPLLEQQQLCQRIECVILEPGTTPVTSIRRFLDNSALYWKIQVLREIVAARPLILKRFYRFGVTAIWKKLEEILDEERFDIVQYEHLPTGELLNGTTQDSKSVLDLHNVYSAMYRRRYDEATGLLQRGGRYLEWRRVAAYEQQITSRVDHCLTVSDLDRQALIREVPQAKLSVIPNGVDTQYFTPWPDPEDRHDLVYAGAMNYMPNIEAMEFFCGEVLPRVRKRIPTVRLFIVGYEPHRRVQALASQDGVIVTGAVHDVRPYFARCAVFVVPLLSGGGTRIKILEALAMGRAVVSTTVGAEGLDLKDSAHLLIADRPEDFAERILDLLGNRALRSELGCRGREVVVEKYDWSAIAETLEGVYKEIVNGGP